MCPADYPWRVVSLPLPDAVPWWVGQLHEGGGGLRNADEGRKVWRGAFPSIPAEVWPCGSLLDVVAVYLYRSNWWPWRGSDALPKGGGFRLSTSAEVF